MRLGLISRLYVLWGFVVATSSVTKSGKRKVAGRISRQVFEAEVVEGVWSSWGEWSECSQTCGVGVSQRGRKCLPPPPPQTPPLSHFPPNWGGYLPEGIGSPVISAMRPYYRPRYPGQHPPYHAPPLSTNHNPGLSLYRNNPPGGGGGPVSVQANPSPPFYQPEFSPTNQDLVSLYRSPYQNPSHGYNQAARITRRPTNPGEGRAGGGGNRRSTSTSREGVPARRSSAIRPGQFGYGRVPFSLPLHRPNRQARHTVNGTEATATPPAPEQVVNEDEAENNRKEEEEKGTDEEHSEAGRKEEQEIAETPAAEELPATTPTPGSPQRHVDRPSHTRTDQARGRERERPSPSHSFSRPSSASVHTNRRTFNWHSVAAPPPPTSPLSQPHSPAISSPFSSPLHRPGPVHRDRELHPGFSPQAPPPVPGTHQGNVYALQYPHMPHLGMEASTDGGRGAPQVHRCSGPEVEYRRCFSQVCAGGVLDSRAEQCAAFNAQEFMGRLYNWEPFTEVGANKQCELTCRPAGYRFYVRQAERVRDGTPCFSVSTNDVCVEGRCMTEGCDGVLGSGSVIDKCRVCGGRESSCRKVTGSFQNVSVPLGYHKILDIPPGATFINITERRASPNYLAMRSGTGVSVVNGRWAVDRPGEYKAGGTTFTYTRPRAQTEGEEERGETLTAPGPTTTQLQLYIIFHQKNPGIDYEFYIPVEKKEAEREKPREIAREALRLRPRDREREMMRERARERAASRAPLRSPLTVSVEDPVPPPPVSAPSFPSSTSIFSPPSSDRWTPERSRPRNSAPNRNARIPPRTDLPPDTQSPFLWRIGGLTECSATCGKGSQYRVTLCINRHTDEEVPERNCDSAAKPTPEEEPCNTHACPPFWEALAWSECSVSCGPGVQQRQLQCRQSFGNRSTMVHPQRCANLSPLESTQVCQLRLCSHWEVSSDWSTCSVDCGVGKRTRNVRCVSEQGGEVSDQECNSRLRPEGSEECNMGPCVTNWYFTGWSRSCSAQCGPGVQKREVVCLTRGGVREGGGGVDCVGEKPAEMKACNGGPCVPRTIWYSSPWTQCNVPCGNGTQRRDSICVQKTGNDFSVVPSSECAHMDKPPSVQECEMGPCQPQWFTTEWSTCSRSCGKGLQMREVRCLTPGKKHSQECDSTTRPEQEQFCNTLPCSPHVQDENCRDRRHNCVMVVQARLCVYSYYKAACCASCAQSAQRAKRQ